MISPVSKFVHLYSTRGYHVQSIAERTSGLRQWGGVSEHWGSREDTPLLRIASAFLGLVAGDAVLLALLLFNALRAGAALMHLHLGNPAGQFAVAMQIFLLCASFSIVGWLVVGIPAALYFSTLRIRRLHWIVRMLVGAGLGPLALLAILFVLGRGRLTYPASFTNTTILWIYSAIVSTVSFLVYAALLRRDSAAHR